MAFSRSESEDVEQSAFHGGFGKIMAIRTSLWQARRARNKENWGELYNWLESVYYEVYPWLIDNQKSKKGGDVKLLYERLRKEWEDVREEMKKEKNGGKSDVRGAFKRLELDLRLALKKFGLDMPEKYIEKGYEGGAI